MYRFFVSAGQKVDGAWWRRRVLTPISIVYPDFQWQDRARWWRPSVTREGRDLPTKLGTYQFNGAGTYLKSRFGDGLITIGNVVRRGEIGCAGFNEKLNRTLSQSSAGLTGAVGASVFLLDLRAVPSNVVEWLNEKREFGQPDEVFGLDESFDLAVGTAFDVLFYLDTVTPACRL
jgi:hypothetical protein